MSDKEQVVDFLDWRIGMFLYGLFGISFLIPFPIVFSWVAIGVIFIKIYFFGKTRKYNPKNKISWIEVPIYVLGICLLVIRAFGIV